MFIQFSRRILLFLLSILYSSFLYGIPFEGTEVLVSGPSPYLPSVIQKIHKQGGNIVDMAVASALSLSVTHPYYVSLASGGFALVKYDSKVMALDFREMAPNAMGSDFYKKTGLSSQRGGAAVGVPGFLKGLEALHKKHGKLSWAQLVKPSIALAKKGFLVSGDWVSITKKSQNKFNESGKKIFFKKGNSYKPNERLKQPQLAKALILVKKQKSKALYQGPIGKDIVSSVQKNKGVMTRGDLRKYKERWLQPTVVSYRGYKIYSMPLPSSGGIILSRMFKLVEKQKVYKKNFYSVNEFHLLGEIMSRAFRPRHLMGDPDFSSFKQEDWISGKAINQINKTIFLDKSYKLPSLKESAETTHISLIDRHGNAVAMTLTVNGFYGSRVVTDKYGIVLNNQMDDFTTILNRANLYGLVQGRKNKVEGLKRPLSSMTPAIVERRGGQTVMAIGGAGGPTIITSVFQTMYRYLSRGLNIEQAIHSPRIHHQFSPSSLSVENKRLSPEVIYQLKTKGHKIKFRDYIGQVFAVVKNKEKLSSSHENRREGFSGGL